MEKLRNLSLKKTIIFYIAVSLLFSLFLSAVLGWIVTRIQEQITWKYVEESQYLGDLGNSQDGVTYKNVLLGIDRNTMSTQDRITAELCDFIQTYAILVLSVTGSSLAVALFYKNKLKPPIEELRKGAELAANAKLDFHVGYENKDELGQLCRAFENMRGQLAENNRELWRMVEEEKTLRAAIAHDIRSPLSVLQGYQEMLLEFVPEENFNREQMMELLTEGMKQIGRMDHFIETMRKMSSLEAREIQSEAMDVFLLAEAVQREGEQLRKETGKRCAVSVSPGEHMFYGDREIILEVTENLLSNALRYAEEAVWIRMELSGKELVITVEDDGSGFTEDSEVVTKAFYHSNPQDDLKHFGLGMYISRTYCEKHGGILLLKNQEHGGAVVKAVFRSNKQEETSEQEEKQDGYNVL